LENQIINLYLSDFIILVPNSILAEHSYPVPWIDAMYEKVRCYVRVISMAIQVDWGISHVGNREVLAIKTYARGVIEELPVFI